MMISNPRKKPLEISGFFYFLWVEAFPENSCDETL